MYGRLTKMAHYYSITGSRKAHEIRPDEQRARPERGESRGEATPTMSPTSERQHAYIPQRPPMANDQLINNRKVNKVFIAYTAP